MQDPRMLREMADMVLSPAWKQLLLEVEEMVRKDTESLVDKVRTENDGSVRHWGGVVDGEARVLQKLRNTEEKARNALSS